MSQLIELDPRSYYEILHALLRHDASDGEIERSRPAQNTFEVDGMLSGRYGTISSGRVLSFIFGFFTVVVLSLVVYKMLTIRDPALLHEWVAALPALGSVLFALTGLPYSATKVTGSLNDLIAAIRKHGE